MDTLLAMLPPMLEGAGTTLKLFFITLALAVPLGIFMGAYKAAEAFFVWRGIRPDSHPAMELLQPKQ